MGHFPTFGDAELRALNAKLVEWKYTSSGLGRRELIEPAPVQPENLPILQLNFESVLCAAEGSHARLEF
jgi:hypothetical protein